MVGRSKYEGKSRCLSVSVTAGICTSSSAPFVIFAESSAYCTWMTTQHVHHNAPYHQHARSLRWHSLDERACWLTNPYRQGLKTSRVTVL